MTPGPTPPAAEPFQPLRVCVAALTRRRPRMLQALLESLAECRIPAGVEPLFLIVENDRQARSVPAIEAVRARFRAGPLLLVLETELGIPFGRNRAIDEALAWNADLLAFIQS